MHVGVTCNCANKMEYQILICEDHSDTLALYNGILFSFLSDLFALPFSAGLLLSAVRISDDHSSRARSGGDGPRHHLYYFWSWCHRCIAVCERAGLWDQWSYTE